jgi:hypothetical protein
VGEARSIYMGQPPAVRQLKVAIRKTQGVCHRVCVCIRCAVRLPIGRNPSNPPCHPKLKNLRASRHTPMRRTPARDSTRIILMRYMLTCLSRRCTFRACCSHRVQASQACNPHRRVAPMEHIFHKRAALTGVQPSQACSSHRRIALTGV